MDREIETALELVRIAIEELRKRDEGQSLRLVELFQEMAQLTADVDEMQTRFKPKDRRNIFGY